jgi:hypothetical protein
MPFECYPVVVLKCHAVYMYLQFTQHWLLLWKLSKLKDHYSWYMYGIYHAYTWYMPCHGIFKIFLKCRFDGQFLFSIIPSFTIRLSSIIALDYSIDLPINPWKKQFDIHCIYLGYTRCIPPLGIYMVYTDYIPRRDSRCRWAGAPRRRAAAGAAAAWSRRAFCHDCQDWEIF